MFDFEDIIPLFLRAQKYKIKYMRAKSGKTITNYRLKGKMTVKNSKNYPLYL